jgi:hypothetical protein
VPWYTISVRLKSPQVGKRTNLEYTTPCSSEMKRAYFKPLFRELSKADAMLGPSDTRPPKSSAKLLADSDANSWI